MEGEQEEGMTKRYESVGLTSQKKCALTKHGDNLAVLVADDGRQFSFCQRCGWRKEIRSAAEATECRGPRIPASVAHVVLDLPERLRYVGPKEPEYDPVLSFKAGISGASGPVTITSSALMNDSRVGEPVSMLCAHGLHGVENLVAYRDNQTGYYWRCTRCGARLAMGAAERKAHKKLAGASE